MFDEYLGIAFLYFLVAMTHLYDLYNERTNENYILFASFFGLVIFYMLLWREYLVILLKVNFNNVNI